MTKPSPSAPPLVARPVAWHRSLFVKLGLSFAVVSSAQIMAVSLLVAWTHNVLLEHYVPSADIAALNTSLVTQLVIIELFGIATAALLAYLLARYLTEPLQRLQRAMRRIAQGDLAAGVANTRQDELGTLVEFFNHMVEQLRAVRERDQHVSDLKTRFVSVAAHQLRTPLTSMKWANKLLLDGDAGTLTGRARTIVAQQAQINDRLVRLVNQLLSVSRIEAGKFVADFKEVELVRLIQHVVAESAGLAHAKQVTLTFDNRAHTDVTIIADAERLKLMLANVLDNAIQYSQTRGAVTVGLAAKAERVTISVTDHGIGIPAAEQNKIFARFYRAPNAMRTHTDGSGLGLYIARSIIRRHGGNIRFESAENQGTTFYITLPRQRQLTTSSTSLEEFVESM